MRPANVVLIGFMGAGKTEVGRALAVALGYALYDTDSMVERDAGRPIPEIFASEGEEAFRAREADAVLRACAGRGRVIACGGGAIVQFRNYGVLRGAGPVVYLRTGAETLRARLGDFAGRPMLESGGFAFDRLLAERLPAYEAAADHIVDTDDLSPEEVAGRIVEMIE